MTNRNYFKFLGPWCGGGLVVNMLTFYSNKPSWNYAEADSFYCKIVALKERK